jgi:hypothetical protein
MSTSAAALDKAIKAMTDSSNVALYDVTIVCTTDDHQADYWMKRLAEGICKSKNTGCPFPMVLAVSEDWSKGGAGNGLGTLYAYEKACRVATEKYQIDLNEMLKANKVSAALYHTAGKGTRLAPLPASENNNKPGVVSFNHDSIEISRVPFFVHFVAIQYTHSNSSVIFNDYSSLQ